MDASSKDTACASYFASHRSASCFFSPDVPLSWQEKALEVPQARRTRQQERLASCSMMFLPSLAKAWVCG